MKTNTKSFIKTNRRDLKLVCLIAGMYYLSTIVHSQVKDTIYLWPDIVSGENEAKQAPLQTNNTKGGVIRLTQVTNPALLVFEPEKQNHSGKGIIICPGGGYRILAIDKEGYEIAEWLNEHGYTAFVLQYRVPNKQLEALNDLQQAIRIVRSCAAEYGLSPNKLGVLGFSAGGNLCARAACMFSCDTSHNYDSLDKVSSHPNFAMLIYPAYLDKGKNRSIAPELHINYETAPFFIFGTADDHHGNSSLVMASALRDHNVPFELHVFPQGGHGYGKRSGNIAAETWPSLALKWLEER
jgi:acetyl esterase/lipase